MLSVRHFFCAGVQRLILLVLQLASLIGLKHLVSLYLRRIRLAVPALFGWCSKPSEHLIKQCLRHIIGITVGCLYLAVGILRVHAECHIGRKCPRRRGPCEEVGILPDNLETNHSGTLLDRLISLCHLL